MILMVGATGSLGGLITQKLLAAGERVRVLVRPQSRYQPLVEAGATFIFGDLKDRPSLDTACAGADVVITTANAVLRDGEDTIETVDVRGNRNLIDAARAAGVKQFIFISALGADGRSPIPLFKAKGLTEEYLQSSGLPYTILRPDALAEVWPGMVVGAPAASGQTVTLVAEATRRHSYISAGDVAAFAVGAVGHPRAIGRVLALGGPAALSFKDVVLTYEKVLGHSIPVRMVAPGQPVPGLPAFMAENLAGFEMFDSILDTAPLAETFGVTLTPLEEVVRRTQPGPLLVQ